MSTADDFTQQNNAPPLDYAIPWSATIISKDKGEIEIGAAAISTEKLEISASVYSQFVYGEWVCTFDPNIIEEGTVAIGTKIRFRFQPGNSPIVDVFLCILSIEITSVTDAIHVGTGFGFTLVSPWYFDQISDSHAYQGRISDVIQKVINDELSTSFLFSPETGEPGFNIITTGEANANAIRYRTEMTPSTFFEKRLRPHIRGNKESAIFMYTNIKDQFNLIDYPEMLKQQFYTAIDFSHPNVAAYRDLVASASLTSFMIYPRSDTFKLNTRKDRDLWALCNPALLFMYHINGETKIATDDPVLKFLTNNFDQRFTFVRNDAIPSLQTKTYMDDSFHDYEDLYSEVLNDYNKRLIENQAVAMVCSPNINIDVGHFCTRIITKPSHVGGLSQFSSVIEIPSLFKQDYIITEVSHVFRGIRGISYVTLGTPAFKYVNAADVTSLWAPK